MGTRIVVVGDVMNDIVVVPKAPMRPDTDTDARIQPRPGGSAANTAAWIGSLGVPVDFVGVVGSADAEQHADLLRQSQVEPRLQVEPGMPTGSIVLIVEGQARSMFTDRGANAALRPDSLGGDVLAGAGILHVSGYTITKDIAQGAPVEMIRRAVEAGVTVSVDPASAGYLQDYGVDRFLDDMAGVSVIFPNSDEGEVLAGETDPARIGAVLLERFPMVVLKRGAEGSILFRRDAPPVVSPALRVERFVDPTGAGDAFAAGFLARWVRDRDAEAALQQAVHVASRAVMLIGGRPPI